MNETVDILLATYNGEKYVKEQIESILNQTYKNIHLIISDDGSTDTTKEILAEIAKEDDRISIYFQPQNLGYIKNFEFLLKQVTSEQYMLSDQDDIWLPEKVEKSITYMKQEGADLVFTDLQVVDQKLKEIYPSFNDFMLLTRKIEKQIKSYKVNYLYNCVTGCTILSKRKFIQEMLPFPTESKYVAHDHWLSLMVSLQGKLAYLSEKTIQYRQHGNNEIGTNKISHHMKTLGEVRTLFLEVKLGVFGTYIKENKKFPEPLQDLNQRAYSYYTMLQEKNNINFKNWNVFHKLYKQETIYYYLLNFIIMNLPFFGRGLFQIRYALLKIMKKR